MASRLKDPFTAWSVNAAKDLIRQPVELRDTQGEVESIAMTKPKERTRLFEQISNSWELAEEYEKKKKLMQQAEEDAQFSYKKKKNAAAERKHAKQEKEEAEHYQILLKELKESKILLQLFRLYYNEKSIDLFNSTFDEKMVGLNNHRSRLSAAEETFKSKKKDLGKLSREQQQIEKEVKAQEVALNHTRPQYIKAKENTSHHLRKIETAKKCLKTIEKECARQQQEIKGMELEMTDVEKALRDFEKTVEEDMKSRGRDVELEESQLDQYKKLKEEVRKNVATLAQQLDKVQWEQKTDQERILLEQRRQKEVEIVLIGTFYLLRGVVLKSVVDRAPKCVSQICMTAVSGASGLRQNMLLYDGSSNQWPSRSIEPICM
ncbi:hypothetical protein NDU88_006063 [Pleurodeles waltl]|uniref:Uncharacterized protein n=1 Tax=Pleurodeles waltl TaxID=8319 RepID=A0AAV7SNH1_PLEWA|nr:hypothetical protein NDU88_006063 [Pleurodeles waltl]